MKKRWLLVGTVLLCAVLLVTCFERVGMLTDGQVADKPPTVLIDAGHGGFDGGAVAPDGTLEKTLNLETAQSLSVLLRLYGFEVQMTRTDDSGLHDDDAASIREKKVSDMKARLARYEQADINIAIHQNMFGDARYSGTQLFYSDNHPLSKPLGNAIRTAVQTLLQPDNTRELKCGGKDIYLLYKTTKPTVLIECGFLSNAKELSLLKDPLYQRRLALSVAHGVTVYASEYVMKEGA